MLLLDNINQTVKQDLQKTLHKGSKVTVAAACFSIYAYRELKKELESVEELRFLFTSPTFTTDHAPKEEREFYIPRRDREQSLYGTAFEVRLRNELNQKAIVQWSPCQDHKPKTYHEHSFARCSNPPREAVERSGTASLGGARGRLGVSMAPVRQFLC